MIANGSILLIKSDDSSGDWFVFSGNGDEILTYPFSRAGVAVEISTHDDQGISAKSRKVVAEMETGSGFDGVH